MLKKPARCFKIDCPLAKRGFGYAPKAGPPRFTMAIVGEALGQMEALQGEPFVGDAGAILDRLFRNVSIERGRVGIDNACRCKPPNNWLDGAPWEYGAIQSCYDNLEETLNTPGLNVVVPMGGTAIRRVLGIDKREWKRYKKPMESFHGTIHRDPLERFWVVPTFHPSYVQRGNMGLMPVVMHDLLIAKDIAANGWEKEHPDLRVDPPVEFFLEWVRITLEKATRIVGSGESIPWLAVDIETPEKEKGIDESEIEIDDPSYIITRVNLSSSFDRNFALTVPWTGPYISGIGRLLRSPFLRKAFWNANYDRPRLNRNGTPVCDPWYDIMDGWHMLHSNLPRGLGFVAPFYSRYGAWKHLSGSQPGLYAAIDALQTIRCAIGIEEALTNSGQWDAFERHSTLLDRYALKPAEDVGILIDKDRIYEFQEELETKRTQIKETISEIVPDSLIPLEPKGGYKRQPTDKQTGDALEGYFEKAERLDCYKCNACGKVDITTKHRCKERKFYEEEHKKKPFEFGDWEINRWYRVGEFNPASPTQVLNYIKYKGHKPGKSKTKKGGGDSADAATLEKLEKKHKDPFYTNLLALRKIDKVKGTYVDGSIGQMDEAGRVHSVFTNKPSTWRLSSQGFNLQNVVSAGKREDMGLGERFRRCVVAAPGCYLLEADYAGIEAVEVGWFANDPQYIRLAKMSTHAFITTHMSDFKDKVAQVAWPDEELREYLAWVKHNKDYKLLYNRAKRVVHGSNYGLTATGLRLTYPDDFPSVAAAQKVIDLMFDIFPAVKQWQSSVRQRAHEQHYLGGEEHPFRYKHWFWDVFTFKRINEQQRRTRQNTGGHCAQIAGRWYAVYPGQDSKRCIAFYPQSTSGGVLREALLRLFTPDSPYYIGDVYYGKTPFRMPIHDSIVLEVPKSKLTYTAERLYEAMSMPITQQKNPVEWHEQHGTHLTIDVEMEIGEDWGNMKEFTL